jgi:rRNA-processing protein FCF1
MISLIEIRMSFSQISQDYLESLEHKHILLFHEEQKNAEKVEFDFIKSGLEKNQRCFYTTNDPEELKKRMQDFGIPVNENIQNGVLNSYP